MSKIFQGRSIHRLKEIGSDYEKDLFKKVLTSINYPNENRVCFIAASRQCPRCPQLELYQTGKARYPLTGSRAAEIRRNVCLARTK